MGSPLYAYHTPLEEKNITLQQECLWPAKSSTIKVTSGEARFAMKLRVPFGPPTALM